MTGVRVVNKPSALTAGTREYRPDIQYLRALAVGTVVLFHVWPGLLPGGYVGVDVFFVISGYLIIGHLLSETQRTGRVRLGRFWARRIRRLLPAAFAVIIVSMLAAWMLLPRQMLKLTAEHAIASALYVENWILAAASVDYLDAENDPTMFQHYWSLSVEEQFYIAWPLLLVGALLIARRFRRRDGSTPRTTTVVFIVVALIVVASLVASILVTPVSPESSYFSTPLRAWEFGAGGLIALARLRWDMTRLPASTRAALWWLGIAAILTSSLLYSGETVFPGIAAVLPVAGAALAVLVPLPALSTSRTGILRPGLERIGSWSYAIYLWHWPVVVLTGYLLAGDDISPGLGLVLIVGVIALSAVTERWIERPFRFSPRFSSPRRAVVILVVGSAFIVAPSTTAIAAIDARSEARLAAIERRLDNLGANTSASDPRTGFADPVDAELFPDPESRLGDTRNQYYCYATAGEEYRHCGWGDEDAEVRIAVVGDSHAGSYVPALIPLVEKLGWRMDVMTGNKCRLELDPECVAGDAIIDALETGNYTAVLPTSMRTLQQDVNTTIAEWREFTARGLRIVPMVAVPIFPVKTNDCLLAASDAVSAEGCWTSLTDAQATDLDSYGQAAKVLGLPMVNLTDEFCRTGRCPAVIGNVIVYRDSPHSHITATFGRTLTGAIEAQLVPIIEESIRADGR